MNNSVLAGRICTVPQLFFITIKDKTVTLCNFVIAVRSEIYDCSSGDVKNGADDVNAKVDFFECLAFEDAARVICKEFAKGSKIVCQGKFKNYRFSDANKTLHFTNIYLVSSVEFGDTVSSLAFFTKTSGRRKTADDVVVSDLKELDTLFAEFCAAGFMCLNESDYYNICMGMMCMDNV